MNAPHAYENSNPLGYDSNCSACGGKDRDAIHWVLPLIAPTPRTIQEEFEVVYPKIDTTPHEMALLKSAIEILKSDPRKDECSVNTNPKGVDTAFNVWSNSISNPSTTPRRDTMAKANRKVPSVAQVTAQGDAVKAELKAKFNPEAGDTPAANTVVTTADGGTEVLNPTPVPTATKKAQHAAEVEARKAEKAKAKAEKDVIENVVKAEKAARREAAKAERAARLAELKDGKGYVGSMLALADKVKAGEYVKGLTGQLRSNDELAQALDGVLPGGVVKLGVHVLNLESNPYSHLNVGQQSMNLRNKIRGAITKGTLTIDAIKDAIVELDVDSSTSIKAATDAKAKAAAERKSKAAAKGAPAEPTANAE